MITLTPMLRNQPKTLFPEAKTASQAAFVVRIYARAAKLVEDGYRIVQQGRTPVFGIFKPENTDTRIAYRDYLVDLTLDKASCTCEFFVDNKKSCKHIEATLLAIQKELDEEAELLALEEKWANAELPETGCDPNFYLDMRY